jgi:hypothetical protein
MKKLLFLFVIIVSLFATGCNNDDSTNVDPCLDNLPPERHGTWNLVNVTGGIAGVSHDFEPGTIKWTFNTCAGTVSVVNENDDEAVEDFLETGTYNLTFTEYDVTALGCPQYMMAGNTNFGCENHPAQGIMMLKQYIADGYELKFTR